MSKSVTDIITALYQGDDERAAQAHGVGRTAVCNWKADGFFPSRVIPQLLMDARVARIRLSVQDIPLRPARGVAA